MMIESNCRSCGNDFTYEGVRGNPRRYCSSECKRARGRKYYESVKTHRRALDAARYQRDKLKCRHRALVTYDKKKNRESSTWEEVKHLYSLPCHYCSGEGGGIDRRDNALGHTVENVVPCCWRCNYILSDLPAEAKDILSRALKQIHVDDLWDGWEPPTTRKKKEVSIK